MLAHSSGRTLATLTARRYFSTKKPRVAIAGATGAVGQCMLEVLAQRNFPMESLKLLASGRSAGKQMEFNGKSYTIEELTHDSFKDVDIALFSAGGGRSKELAPRHVKAGAVVVDNSSAFRMDPNTPLVVPEVNPEAIKQHKGIIANPNCSTIIMNVAVWPLYQKNKVTRVIASTYQAASGAGATAMEELETQARDWVAGKPLTQEFWGRQYMWNVFSHNSDIDPSNGYCEEEIKMTNETRKIFNDPNIGVAATCIRVPVLRAHCEALTLEFENPITPDEARAILRDAPGVDVVDDIAANKFPEPLDVSGKDNCAVGRIRVDLSNPSGKGLCLYVSGDQLLKGAALNAVQIAELL
eukprot:CAMPEP_0175909008 /NCGR_PEP_ID=MMETSP0108-20121206/6887_1 /TAXON_ID=195067 ORGANISM="Goniomonas pacifica, Strain CCMP1869" /NCGR_SAMPLE_ID=MMETSP0108 /ASSEMBLY_ACC=CAM_ASM_000204 /LENGTH=354 /DNA_ID=CAMNT_0017231071 /DNA_START=9 /DNA_END=1074 /DNA_ORIENTATION=+